MVHARGRNRGSGPVWGAVASGVACLLTLTGLGVSQAKKLNPYTGNADAIKAGRTLYLQYGCSGCHGVGGGGGMGPPLVTDHKWKFGSDDETLYKLIKGQIDAQTMPKIFGNMQDEEVWKILAFVRSIYAGDPSTVNW
jgi:mono/diheme cytochrome c family protein